MPSPTGRVVRAEVEPTVGAHHCVLDRRLLGPNEQHHATDAEHGVSNAELEARHEEVDRLQHVRRVLASEQLADRRDGGLHCLDEGDRVLPDNTTNERCDSNNINE